MIFLLNHKNCSKQGPPAKMQASHYRWRECRTLANTPGISRISPATTAILAGVDGACVNKTLHRTPEEEVLAGEVRRACRPSYRTTPAKKSP
ncbi:hypothetical protein TNCV_2471331 [Trichonephila clavipes]|nr:hypothetical protein TNCV_2471331 [Trichonephila clavipes]